MFGPPCPHVPRLMAGTRALVRPKRIVSIVRGLFTTETQRSQRRLWVLCASVVIYLQIFDAQLLALPNTLELRHRRRGALFLLLARFSEAEERAGIVRIAFQVFAKDLLCFGVLTIADERRSES